MWNWDMKTYCKELEELVNIDSGSFDKEGVAKAAEYLEEKYRKEGLLTELSEDHRHLLAKTHEEESCDLLLIGHIDTVFPKGTAAERPFRMEENRAYGPGVADMKGGDVMVLHLVRWLKANTPYRIAVMHNGDEEIGSPDSRAWTHAIAEKAKAILVFEPGRNGDGMIKARKGCFDLHCEFFGRAAHAAAEPKAGNSAIVMMAEWITKLTALEETQKGLRITAGKVEGGGPLNVVADHAYAGFDVRYADQEEFDAVAAYLNMLQQSSEEAGIKVRYEIKNHAFVMNPTEQTMQLIEMFDRTAKNLGISLSWVKTGGVSDSNYLADIGIPILDGCGPVGESMHNDAECMDLDSVVPRLELLSQAISLFLTNADASQSNQ